MRDATKPYSPQYRETRSKMRELGYLDYDEKRPVENLDEVVLNKDKLSFENAARDIKKKQLQNIIDSESFVNAAVTKFDFKMLQSK